MMCISRLLVEKQGTWSIWFQIYLERDGWTIDQRVGKDGTRDNSGAGHQKNIGDISHMMNMEKLVLVFICDYMYSIDD